MTIIIDDNKLKPRCVTCKSCSVYTASCHLHSLKKKSWQSSLNLLIAQISQLTLDLCFHIADFSTLENTANTKSRQESLSLYMFSWPQSLSFSLIRGVGLFGAGLGEEHILIMEYLQYTLLVLLQGAE